MLNTALLDKQLPLGIALSGGSDSTALLVLAADALGPQNLCAITIDHGLRTGAAQEAIAAGITCAALGVKHEVIALKLEAGSDLQARARTARYDALCEWARRNEVGSIALGHTEKDVSETFLMRLARGSGVDGLARMAQEFTRGDTTFLRPLLDASRADLRDMLRARSISWSEDPSNEDARFKRVQMRQAQSHLNALGLTSERLGQTAKWMRAASDVLEQAADTWIAQNARADHGDAVFDLAALRAAPEETAFRALSRALCNISGNAYRPRLNALIGLLQSELTATLHGCLAYQQKGELRLTRELNAITSTEKRWTVTGAGIENHKIAPLGEIGLSRIGNWRETALLPRRSLLASPAIWQAGKLVCAPLARPDPKWSAAALNPLLLAK